MQVMVRSLSLLLLAVALMLPMAATTGARVDILIAAPAAFAQSATPYHAGQMMMKCHRGFGEACIGSAAACGAYCGAASALIPLVIVLAPIDSPAAVSSVVQAAHDHSNSPDPHPPRPLAIS
jgi:hypothetical protein